MKSMLISFAVGLAVGVAYAVLRVRSPAPPLIALFGLLGMVWGEQLMQRLLAHKPTTKPQVSTLEVPGPGRAGS